MKSEKTAQATNEWEHILLLGCDSRKAGEYERSDCMIVLSINQDGEVRLTSIMRDIWVEIPGHGEGKINAAVVYGGPELAMRVVSDRFDLQIDKYVMVNMKGMVNIIDLLGGVDLELTEDESLFINYDIQIVQRISQPERVIPPLKYYGQVHLCGVQAVTHMRNRFDGGGDFMRTARHRQLLIAIAKKIRTKKSFLWLFGVALRGKKWVRTNLNLPELGRIALLALRQDPNAIRGFRIPAEGTYTINDDGIWRFETDFEKNSQLLRAFLKSGRGSDEIQ